MHQATGFALEVSCIQISARILDQSQVQNYERYHKGRDAVTAHLIEAEAPACSHSGAAKKGPSPVDAAADEGEGPAGLEASAPAAR